MGICVYVCENGRNPPLTNRDLVALYGFVEHGVMASHLLGVKPLPEPMLTYHLINSKEYNLAMRFYLKQNFI